MARSKLTYKQALEIASRFKAGERAVDLANEFDVHCKTIYFCLKRAVKPPFIPKNYTKNISISVPRSVLNEMDRMAHRDHTTRATLIRFGLGAYFGPHKLKDYAKLKPNSMKPSTVICSWVSDEVYDDLTKATQEMDIPISALARSALVEHFELHQHL